MLLSQRGRFHNKTGTGDVRRRGAHVSNVNSVPPEPMAQTAQHQMFTVLPAGETSTPMLSMNGKRALALTPESVESVSTLVVWLAAVPCCWRTLQLDPPEGESGGGDGGEGGGDGEGGGGGGDGRLAIVNCTVVIYVIRAVDIHGSTASWLNNGLKINAWQSTSTCVCQWARVPIARQQAADVQSLSSSCILT